MSALPMEWLMLLFPWLYFPFLSYFQLLSHVHPHFVTSHKKSIVKERLTSISSTYCLLMTCLFLTSVQIGAIYLWSYVYNIVRISSQSSRVNDLSDPKPCSRETSSATEPLLSSTHDLDQYSLPLAVSDEKTEVLSHTTVVLLSCYLCLLQKLKQQR